MPQTADGGRIETNDLQGGGMQRGLIAIGGAALLLSGCAAPPNTPGAGVGKNYTPIIDMRGVNGDRYLDDLSACRTSAAMIDAERQEMAGLIGGALIGAAIGASISRDARVIDAGASSGALHGGLGAGAHARSRQAMVMGNCMASRGYRVIDGTATIAYTVPLPPQNAVPAPAPAAAAPTPLAVAAPVSTSIQIPREAPAPKPVKPAGEFGFEAAKFAREQRCASFDTPAQFVAKGAGFESYSVACTNGDVMMVRCEFGTCRALR